MFEEELPVEVGDETPSLIDQAKKKGWDAAIFDFGKAEHEGVEFFNPGLVRRPDGLWLLVRRSEITPGMWYGKNGIWACKLGDDRTPMGGPPLRFRDSADAEQFEDPRAVYWNGQTWIGVVNFTWFPNGSWTGAHQAIGVFQDQHQGEGISEASWTPIARRDPSVGTNSGEAGPTHGKHNKNLTWFFHEDKLHCVYTSDPWLIVEFGSKWDVQKHHIGEGVKWKYGLVRGGTPPVLVGDRYYTFFHSSLPWRGRYRRYYMGAIAFDARPPFNPVLWTQEPLLIGSQNDAWHQKKPLVVFPCGAVHEHGKWFVTYGVNDLKSGWVEIPHDHLLQLLNPIPVAPGAALLSTPTDKPEYEPIPFETETEYQQKAGAPDVASEGVLEANPIGVSKESVKIGTQTTTTPALSTLGKPRGRPRKDGLPPGSVPPKPKRKYRRRRKKALKSKQ